MGNSLDVQMRLPEHPQKVDTEKFDEQKFRIFCVTHDTESSSREMHLWRFDRLSHSVSPRHIRKNIGLLLPTSLLWRLIPIRLKVTVENSIPLYVLFRMVRQEET